jgi:hypothetical protein
VLAASLTFLTPAAGLVGLAALLPVGAALAGSGRAETVRRALGLAPAPRRGWGRVAAQAGAIALLGLAATQPVLTHTTTRSVRRDVQALFVLDTSRSMGASAGPASPTRLDRAAAAASRLRAAIGPVESGVATLTDRVLPDLLPVGDRAGFDAVLWRAVAIESPPPRQTSFRATSYSALAGIPAGGYFAPTARKRVVVLLTDGETVPTDTAEVARTFGSGPTTLLAVRFWKPNESVFDRDGRREAAYRPDPSGRAALAALAAATHGRAYEEGDLAGAAGFLRSAVGDGPTVAAPGNARTRTPLAPYLVGLALIVLALPSAASALARRRSRQPTAPGLGLSPE